MDSMFELINQLEHATWTSVFSIKQANFCGLCGKSLSD